MKRKLVSVFLALSILFGVPTVALAEQKGSLETKNSPFEEGELVRYAGYAIRADGRDGLRFYFDIDPLGIRMLEETGITLEIGAVVNLDKETTPLYDESDAKLVAYSTQKGREEGFFTDEDTYAVTLRYHEESPEVRDMRASVVAYTKLTRTDGMTEVYFDRSSDSIPSSLSDAYEMISKSESPEYLASPTTVERIEKLVGMGIEYASVYLDAAAPAGGDGSIERPYQSFEDAFEACKTIMQSITTRTKVFLVIEEGEYAIHTTQTMTKEDMPYEDTYFYIVARGENTVLKTTEAIDAEGFTFEGNNVYSYQFDKASGAYPSFRSLYVDGALATIATNGSDHSYEKEDLYVTAFDRNYSARGENARSVGKMYLPEGVVGDLRHLMKGASNVRTALLSYKIEMHITCQWNYNIIHVAGVDYNDYAMSGGQKHVAVYLDMDEYSLFQINSGHSTAGRYVHMKNADIYLDEDGEYRYDEKNGKLYYYSTTGVEGKDFGYATLDNMLVLRDVRNLTLSGVSFTGMDDYYLSEHGYTGGLGGMNPYVSMYGAYSGAIYGQESFVDRAALYMRDCVGVSVLNCRFYDLPCEGFDVTGWAEDLRVEGCTFTNIGGCALRIGTHVRTRSHASWVDGELGARDVSIQNNYFHDIANEYYVPALMVCKLDGGKISHNTIRGCTYSAMCLGWGWWDLDRSQSSDMTRLVNLRDVEISYNYIADFMTEMADGGAIYFMMRNANLTVSDYEMNAVHHNVIVFSDKTGDALDGMVVGIYFDGSSSNYHCYENVIYEQSLDAPHHGSTLASSYYIYLQHINGQETYHILVEDNYIMNVRGTNSAEQHSEVYRNYFTVKEAATKRDLKEVGTRYVNGTVLPAEAEAFVPTVGADGHTVNVAYLSGDAY